MLSSIPRVPNYNPRTNLCDLLPEPIQLSCTHEGLELKGHFVYINPSDHTVLLDSPYGGIEAGSHVPAFAMLTQNRNVVDGVITEKCLKAGESALIAAYKEADFLFRHKDALHKKLLVADREIASIQIKLESLRIDHSNEKQRLKALFKSGEIPESEYTSYIKKGRKRIEDFNSAIETIRRDIFSGFPDYTQHFGNESQDIEFIRKHAGHGI